MLLQSDIECLLLIRPRESLTLTWGLNKQIKSSSNNIKTSPNLKTFNVKSTLSLSLSYRITVRMRDGFELPLVMAYDKQHFNEKSPWIMFTKGSVSNKADLQFDNNKISLM